MPFEVKMGPVVWSVLVKDEDVANKCLTALASLNCLAGPFCSLSFTILWG